MAQEALTIARSVGDKAWQSMALTYLATSHDPRNTPDMRNAYSQEFLRLVEELRSPITNSMTTITLAIYARFDGDLQRSRQYLEEARKIFIDLEDHRFELVVQSELAHADRISGDLTAAQVAYRHTMQRWKGFGNRAAIANQLECFAFIAQAQGELIRSARMLGAAEALREQADSPMTGYERGEYERVVEILRGQMDATAFAQEWARGRALPMDDAIEFALSEPASDLMARE
jgi:hypothetical protein